MRGPGRCAEGGGDGEAGCNATSGLLAPGKPTIHLTCFVGEGKVGGGQGSECDPAVTSSFPMNG